MSKTQTNENFIWLAGDIKIAGDYDVDYWKDLRGKRQIVENTDGQDWNKAFDVFETRVNTRFLDPIDKVLGMYLENGKEIYPKKGKGEGFSAVALQCVLIEFFGAFYNGKTYNPNPDYHNYEYKKAYGHIFKPFLTSQSPFSNFFCKHRGPDTNCEKVSAYTFYKDFRCGLIHEAATKGSSIIRGEKRDKDDNSLDLEHKILIGRLDGKIILYRTPFQKALKQYIKTYRNKLMFSDDRKEAFKKKMDKLCQISKP